MSDATIGTAGVHTMGLMPGSRQPSPPVTSIGEQLSIACDRTNNAAEQLQVLVNRLFGPEPEMPAEATRGLGNSINDMGERLRQNLNRIENLVHRLDAAI